MLTGELIKKIEKVEEDISLIRYNIESNKRPANETILDDVDLQKLLNVSKRKTAQWREEGLLPYCKPSGKIFYLFSDVLEMLENAKIAANQNAIRDFLQEKQISRKKKTK